MKKLSALISLAILACSCSQPPVKVSSSHQVTIQSDAGVLVCEYVDVTYTGSEALWTGLEGETAKVGICTLNASQLAAEVEIAKHIYGLAGLPTK